MCFYVTFPRSFTPHLAQAGFSLNSRPLGDWGYGMSFQSHAHSFFHQPLSCSFYYKGYFKKRYPVVISIQEYGAADCFEGRSYFQLQEAALLSPKLPVCSSPLWGFIPMSQPPWPQEPGRDRHVVLWMWESPYIGRSSLELSGLGQKAYALGSCRTDMGCCSVHVTKHRQKKMF